MTIMSHDKVEYRVAAMLGDEPFEDRSEWERFRSIEQATRYAGLLVQFGLGAVVFAFALGAGIPAQAVVTEVARYDARDKSEG
jgi:hypothetical protein